MEASYQECEHHEFADNKGMYLVIFDLDGTLVDSKQDLVNSVNATREHMGLDHLDDALVASYVGRGAPALIRSSLGEQASDEDLERGLGYFLAYYREHMLDYTHLYPGVRESIERLHSAGTRLAILTNKPARFSEQMIDRLGLADRFFRIYGGNSFAQKKPDPIGIDKLCEESRIAKDRTIMIGDSSVDIRTARNAGVRSCGVSYGFQPESFKHDPPDVVVDSMEEITDMLLNASLHLLGTSTALDVRS